MDDGHWTKGHAMKRNSTKRNPAEQTPAEQTPAAPKPTVEDCRRLLRKLREPMPEAEIAAHKHRREREDLDWAWRAINAWRWNRGCRSAHCRRNGCADVSRCEPRFHDALAATRLTLSLALLQENAISRDVREDGSVPQVRALLADARARGLLPLWPDPADALAEFFPAKAPARRVR
jgi:hypothetical protein